VEGIPALPRWSAARLILKLTFDLSIVPIDDVKDHSAPDHFGFEIGSVLLPIWRFPDAEPGLLAEGNQFIVGFEGAADALVHHGEAIVCKSLIVHRGYPNEKADAGLEPVLLTVPWRVQRLARRPPFVKFEPCVHF
jgi:hypothetical protein